MMNIEIQTKSVNIIGRVLFPANNISFLEFAFPCKKKKKKYVYTAVITKILTFFFKYLII